MFIIGKANDAEIAEMKKMGFEVEDVDITNFDKALDKSLPDDYAYCQTDENDTDKLVSTFIDCDIVQECKKFDREKRHIRILSLQHELDKVRDKKIEEVWNEYDLIGQALFDFVDCDGWEHTHPGDEYTRNFYVEKSDETGESEQWRFVIRFKPDSSEVVDTYVIS